MLMHKHDGVRSARYRKRYTIVEMMMVTAIFLIILSMAIAAWVNSGTGTRLRSAASLVHGQLNLARAKAVAERRGVYLYFAKAGDDHRGYACQLRYEDNVDGDGRKDKPLPGEDWVILPAGTVFSAAEPADSETALAVPGRVVFDAKGRIKDFSGVTATKLYVVAGEQAKYGSLKLKNADEDSYFAFEINPFSGRVTTTFHVNEN